CESRKTLVSVMAYHSFAGEVGASNTSTIRRLTLSRRHQLSPIAHADPHKTAPTPPCLRARSSTLFASIFGLAGWLLMMMCVRAIAWLRPRNSADVPRLHLRPSPIINKSLQHQR